jgi:sugar/nucleoside kinase (ribokinase family)
LKAYDLVMIGHVSRDIMVSPDGREERLIGGAVVYSSAAAARSGARVLVVTKAAAGDRPLLDVLDHERVEVVVIESPRTTSIRNVYLSEDRERREVSLVAGAAPFALDELPAFAARALHLAGLFHGEIPPSLVPALAWRVPLAVDAQGWLRRVEAGRMLFRDLPQKKELLPLVRWLKADLAEAEVLTGETDQERAARALHAMGAVEVMVTHNTGVMVVEGGRLFRAPFTSRNLSGRTGRGDTCFASYLTRRLSSDPQESVNYAAALTSIKMETPGVFRGTVADVLERMRAAPLSI